MAQTSRDNVSSSTPWFGPETTIGLHPISQRRPLLPATGFGGQFNMRFLKETCLSPTVLAATERTPLQAVTTHTFSIDVWVKGKVGRPLLTVGICERTRTVTGFEISCGPLAVTDAVRLRNVTSGTASADRWHEFGRPQILDVQDCEHYEGLPFRKASHDLGDRHPILEPNGRGAIASRDGLK